MGEKKLVDLTINEFLNKTSSLEPTPGGGSVAALNGALATSLIIMVSEGTISKKGFEDYISDLKSISTKALELKTKLQEKIDEDSLAYNSVVEAFKLPKKTDEEKKKRSEEIQKSFLKAAVVPLEVANLCLETLILSIKIATIGKEDALSDSLVAGLNAICGCQGAIENVRINLKNLKESKEKESINKKLFEIEKSLSEYCKEFYNISKQKITL